MSSRQSSHQTCAALASSKSRRLLGSILVVSASALLSAHPTWAFASPCDQRSVTAETDRAIEADFYACVLNGLAKIAASESVESVEDGCAFKLYAAIDTDHAADDNDSSERAEVDDDWWSEF